MGKLTIKNDLGNQDAVVCLTWQGSTEPLIAVYIPRGKSFVIQHIPDGIYQLYFTQGKNWDFLAREFREEKGYYRFRDLFRFMTVTTTRRVGKRIYRTTYYTVYEVTLYGVIGGNAQTEEIEKGDFPVLQ